MPIIRPIDHQRRLAQTGRIRIGQKVEGTRQDGSTFSRPASIDKFRLTSANEKALRQCAEIYGGVVEPWTDSSTPGQFELFTESKLLRVLLPPEALSFSQWYEQWSGGGCTVRCDGQWDIKNERDCACDFTDEEADPKTLCKPHTRLSLMFESLPGIGLWRLDTQGKFAMDELEGAIRFANDVVVPAIGRSLIPATLRLEQRTALVNGRTKQFVVPVLDFDIDMTALARGGLTPVALTAGKPTLADEIQSLGEPPALSSRKNAAEPVKATNVPLPTRTMPTDAELKPLRTAMALLTEDESRYLDEKWGDLPPVNGLSREQIQTAYALVVSVLPGDEDGGAGTDAPSPQNAQNRESAASRGNRADLQPGQEPFSHEDGGARGTTTTKTEGARPTTQISTKQIGLIRGKLKDQGVEDNDAIHAEVARILKRDHVESLNDLTKGDASKIIDQLLGK